MHCLPSKRSCMRNDPENEMADVEWMALWHRSPWDQVVPGTLPHPRTDCPAPFVSRGQSKDDKKQMEMLAPGLSSCTPAACERPSCCELHIRISSTALPHGSTSLAPITLVWSSLPFQPLCLGAQFVSVNEQYAFVGAEFAMGFWWEGFSAPWRCVIDTS